MATVLPKMGRNGIVNLCRKISGSNVSGWRKVDSSAEFVQGMVATLTADGDESIVTVVSDGDVDQPLGILMNHKTVSFYQPIIAEDQTFGDTDENNTADTVTLNRPNVKSGSVLAIDASDNTLVLSTSFSGTMASFTAGDDYGINLVNGIITRNDESSVAATNAIGATDTITISYKYEDAEQAGIDETLGSGKVSVLEDYGEVATRTYDTTKTYALSGANSRVAVGDDGIPTIAAGNKQIGIVTKVPSASDVELHFKLKMD